MDRRQTRSEPIHVLRLYVAGNSPRSRRLIEFVHELYSRSLGEVDIEIIDVYQQAERARREGIMVAPMLVRERPLPRRSYVGHSVDTLRIDQFFDLAGGDAK